MARVVSIPVGELTEFDLPKVCVVSGTAEDIVFRKAQYQYVPPWVAVFILLGALPYVIVAAIVAKRAKGVLPYSAVGRSRALKARLAMAGSVLAVIPLCAAPFVLTPHSSDVFLFASAAGLVWLVGMIVTVAVMRRRLPFAKKISDTHIDLYIPSDAAADAIEARLNASRPLPVASVDVVPAT